MIETATADDIRQIAANGGYESATNSQVGAKYSPDCEPRWDGVMHAYHDSVRVIISPSDKELKQKVGACNCFQHLCGVITRENMVVDDKIYAAHIFHEVTDLAGKLPEKLEEGRRY